MIEHRPWVGPLYASEGIGGQKIAIMGYSAWGDYEPAEMGTIHCIEQVIERKWRIHFFTKIAGYFGLGAAEFYNRVVFFEFVPGYIGLKTHRYAWATREQAVAGGERMLRIAEEHHVEKLVVFSKKAWSSMPESIEDGEKRKNTLEGTHCTVAHYDLGHRPLPTFGLPHPQYAIGNEMRSAVSAILART